MKYSIRGWKTHSTYQSIRFIYQQIMDSEARINIKTTEKMTNGDTKVSNGLKTPEFSYKETLAKLMEHDSNLLVLKKTNPSNPDDSRRKLTKIIGLLEILNIKLDDLNKLNVIHIAGTKGKGSTCAYIESILRERGYKTGLYTSPHLVSVRERIRLSGQPVSADLFVKYFWEITRKLGDVEKPGYFMFLTILSFYIFLKEKVDVAIIETGIGGEFDCTRIVPKPIATGITSLGIDHTSILGDTLESIAWHKAGILKPDVFCFTSPQPSSAFQVIRDRSIEKSCEVLNCPPMENYESHMLDSINLGIDGHVQRINASLALLIARYFHLKMTVKDLHRDDVTKLSDGFVLDKEEIYGLAKTKWLGRCQLINRGNVDYFLDGAHTVESLDNCVDWFKRKSYSKTPNEKVFRILLFFSAGLRQFEPLIHRVAQEPFNAAIFPSNSVDNPEIYPEMIADSRFEMDRLTDRITKTKEMWQSIQKDLNRDYKNCHQFSSLTQALEFLESNELRQKYSIDNECKLHVLVTGSLLFVGNVITIIDTDSSS